MTSQHHQANFNQLGRKPAWEMGIKFVQIKRLALSGPIRGKRMKKFDKFSKSLLLMNHWLECINVWHAWGKEIQVCSNEVPRVMYGLTPGA